MFKSLTKSRSNRSSNGSAHSHGRRESEPKGELAITAPRQIVKALHSYVAERPEELSFAKNDFFYVSDEPAGDWLVAFNPLQNTRGLVPKSFFEIVRRQDTHAVPVSQARMPNARSRNQQNHNRSGSQTSLHRDSHPLMIYGFVLYDFKAERNDELTVSAGDCIVIVAQSTEEWFVAKPIGHLGGPGLIPVSYVELREVGTEEVLTDVKDAIRRANLPHVDEWKRKLAEYKASSIPLGNGASAAAAAQAQAQAHPQRHISTTQSSHGQQHRQTSSTQQPYVVQANVDRFAINGGRYWYLVKVEMSNGKHRNLCRYYQDFYDFQIKLLEQFPVEAGRTGRTRTLPFMPGPLTLITHTVTSQRRANLDEYVRDLIRMPPYISQSPVVLDLFGVHPGDVESDGPTDEVPMPPEDENNIHYSGDMPEEAVDWAESETPTGGTDTTNPDSPIRETSGGGTHKPSGSRDVASRESGAATTASAARESREAHSRKSSGAPGSMGDADVFSDARSFPESFSTATVDEIYAERYGERSASLNRPAPGLKVKVYAHDEVFAIRMPAESTFAEIFAKISARLGVQTPNLYMSPDFAGEPITTQQQFDKLLAGGTKTALYLGP